LAGMSVFAASAAPPGSSTTVANNTGPATAALIWGQTETIPGNSSLWFRFDYAGDAASGQRDRVSIILPNGTDSGLEFKVWTPGQMSDWWELQPVGQGTPQEVRASNGTPADYGPSQSNDLSWTGTFGESGTYYIQVQNTNDYPMSFKLNEQYVSIPRS
jgi:hypothetical protein